jgi:ribose transport system substrate-binding protein
MTSMLGRGLAAALLAATVAGCGGGDTASTGKTTIAVIPKGTSHEFWQFIHAGANKAGRELDVEIIWRGPLREDDRDAQVSEVEGFISRGVSGIALAPLDEAALVGPVSDAMARQIPVVIFDSGLKGDNYVSFVATDNIKGGRMAGERVADVLGGKGKVVLLRYAEGHDSTGKREQGFLDAVAEHPGLEVVSSNQYGGADVDGAYKKAEALLTTFKKPDGSLDVDAIFCPNESSSFAMLRVLQDNGWAGKVKLVGFDASPALVKAVRDGDLDALIVQDPVQMGYLAVKTLNAHIKGQAVERAIDTPVYTVTKDNVDTPEMKALVEPDLSQWLNQ